MVQSLRALQGIVLEERQTERLSGSEVPQEAGAYRPEAASQGTY